jgi:hypothetical protein
MMKSMDRDLRRAVYLAIGVIAGNAASAALNLWAGHWPIVFAAVIWIFGGVALWLIAHSMQQTRDEARVLIAMRKLRDEEYL